MSQTSWTRKNRGVLEVTDRRQKLGYVHISKNKHCMPGLTFMDGFIYVFGYGMQRAYLLPVYATYFSDISSIYTIARLPYIARWFFARLCSSSFCLVALLFTNQKLTGCSRRFLAIVTTTIIFYAIFSIPIDIFRS
ncbi:unnamed protein product [Heligmosomoides polygyrus]|uniref:MFS_1_like domain-containing protein n=1 Tax=Heligmosomoides polygyrus TaxID=6339 RepID=A0A183FT08_HELPZ|nr:unnamed protein product [Heligmosomoides polygyrus]